MVTLKKQNTNTTQNDWRKWRLKLPKPYDPRLTPVIWNISICLLAWDGKFFRSFAMILILSGSRLWKDQCVQVLDWIPWEADRVKDANGFGNFPSLKAWAMLCSAENGLLQQLCPTVFPGPWGSSLCPECPQASHEPLLLVFMPLSTGAQTWYKEPGEKFPPRWPKLHFGLLSLHYFLPVQISSLPYS